MNKGLGDTIAHITKVTGIEGIVKRFSKATGIDCGCDRRREMLNKLFPKQRKPPQCMTRDQYELWTVFREEQKGNKVNPAQQQLIAQLHHELFDHKFIKPCSCRPRQWAEWISDIDMIYATYKSKSSASSKEPEQPAVDSEG